MRGLLLVLVLTCGAVIALAQSSAAPDRSPEPEGGVQRLALLCYRINFSRVQRDYLKAIELEFIYAVDAAGRATLEEVNGNEEIAILDSLRSPVLLLTGLLLEAGLAYRLAWHTVAAYQINPNGVRYQ